MAKNGTTQAATAERSLRASSAETSSMAANEDKQWEDLKKQVRETTHLFGGLIFTPCVFFLGVCYGIRAGIIAGLKKTLELFKALDR
jgi:hypothetical protein